MLLPSFLLVVRSQGRYLLRDGYHRAYGLLRRGIAVVPAFVREFAPHENPGLDNPNLLSSAVYFGERPPLLPDYADDTVAAATQLPASENLIVITSVETNMNLKA
jgi:hypothetical protein